MTKKRKRKRSKKQEIPKENKTTHVINTSANKIRTSKQIKEHSGRVKGNVGRNKTEKNIGKLKQIQMKPILE